MITDTPSPPAARSGVAPHRGYRLTSTGLGHLAMTVFVTIATFNSGTNLLYFVLGLMVAAFFVSLLFSWLSLRRISVTRELGDHLVAHELADVTYTFRNDKRFWPVMALRFYEPHPDLAEPPEGFILHLPTRSSATVSTRLRPTRRGMLKLHRLLLSTSFPFGFLTRTIALDAPEEALVYPRIGMLNRHLALQYRESIETGTMTSNVRGGTDEFYGLREYRPGDNIHAIHWRSSARTRQLMIKEMAANAPPQMIVVLNLRSASRTPSRDDHDLAEFAIELAASLICYGFFENFAVGLAIAGVDAEVPPSPTMGRDARASMLQRLAMLDPARHIRPEAGIAQPNRLAGRAEWIIITLHADDVCRDLLNPATPPGSATLAQPGGALRSSHSTILAADAPDAEEWLHFLTPQDTLRLLRDRAAHDAP